MNAATPAIAYKPTNLLTNLRTWDLRQPFFSLNCIITYDKKNVFHRTENLQKSSLFGSQENLLSHKTFFDQSANQLYWESYGDIIQPQTAMMN